jgi:glycosyltransferase involved in cell wall biosynthesis
MKPLVSICIPAYNAEQFIAETLESALRQTYPNIEIIVSDDDSSDRTAEIVREREPQGVRLLGQPRNLGRYGNCNAVIRTSSGKYVLKLDADDLIEPEHVAEQVAVMEAHSEVVFAHCACRLVDRDGGFIGYERSIGGSFIRAGVKEWPRYVIGSRAVNVVMIRRSAFDQVGGYDERYHYSGDWAMHRALLRIGDVYYNDRVLASYRVHDVGKEGIQRLQAYERLMHLESMESDWPPEVPNKDRLLRRARRRLAIVTVFGAAKSTGRERQEILDLITRYTEDADINLLAALVRHGGAFAIRAYVIVRNRLRLRFKSLILALPHVVTTGPH